MMIKDIKLKTSGLAEGTFIVSKCEFKTFANKPGTFLSCDLSDMSGTIKAVMWDKVDPCKAWLKNKLIVDIAGEISTYKDTPQIQLKLIALAKKANLSEFVPSLDKKRIDELMLSLDKVTIKNDVCRKIWEAILNPPFRDIFKSCPGGVGDVHHAYLGGLLDHSAGMVQIAQELASNQFKDLDKDLLITGCLIHDIGKTESYQWEGIPEMTDAGRLFHHTYIGYGMLLQIADRLSIPRSDQTLMKLAHIIVAHHEDEGIRKTMLPEATAVAMIDNLNASTNFSLWFVGKEENKEADSNWTRFCQLTGRQYYVPKKSEKIDMASILEDF